MDNFKIASLNVNGARKAVKRTMIYEMINQKRISVLFLQETHSDLKNEADWRKEWKGEIFFSHGTSQSSGVGLLFSSAFTPNSFNVENIVQGRCLLVKASFDHFNLVFINIYAPNVGAERKNFLEKIGERMGDCGSDDYVFLGGDFNCTENDLLDRNHKEPHQASQQTLRQLVSSHGLVDVWRRMHTGSRQYTWSHVKQGRISLARIDRFYCFKHHFNVFKTCQILPVAFTDHSLLLGNVFITNILPKSAYWHFNLALTYDRSFREALSYFWTVFRQRKGDFTCLRQWWDHGKVQIKQLCQQHTLNVTRDVTRSIRDLEMNIVELENLSDSTGNRGHIEALKSKRLVLANLLESKVQGVLVRSRVQNITEMDAPSSFFFSLERKRGQRKAIHSLLSNTGQQLSEPGQIRRRAVEFYSSLFESEYKENEGLLEEFCGGLPQVSGESNLRLARPLGLQELHTALLSMQGQKAPGIDGLTAEFFKAYWDILAEDLLDVYNESLAAGSLPLSCRRAVIALLPKKGNLQDIRNWRPVSLLCTDYKILSKALATRLREAMEQVVHRDQTYCVPGRSMVDNIYLIRDVLEVSGSLGLRTGLIALDQEKAFDRVEHSFMWQVLEKFGFGAGLIAKIKVMYSGIESMLKINGNLCAPFRVRRGVRQGCALSGMLYALSLEPLLQKIRSSVHGLVLPGFNSRVVLSAYADDVVVFTRNQQDVDKLTEMTNKFSILSSARVNWGKSEALAVGEWREGLPVLPQGLLWRRDGFKYLGLFLGNENTEKKNWENLEQRIESKLEKWRWLHSHMSYRGRVLVLNNLVASQLWHKLSCLDPPSNLLANIQAKMVDFFWNGFHWVPQSVLFLPREEGGQGLVHLAGRTAAFRLRFVQKYLSGPLDLVWRDVASCVLKRVNNLGLDAALFLTDLSLLNLRGLPKFYQGVFKSCALFKLKPSQTINSLHWLLQEPLICGSRLDVCDRAGPGLSEALRRSKMTTLKQLVETAGPSLSNIEAMGSVMGVRSARLVRRFLDLLRGKLSAKERSLLSDYCEGLSQPDPTDSFPGLTLYTELPNQSGPLLSSLDPQKMVLFNMDQKTVYRACSKMMTQRHLVNRAVCLWTDKIAGRAPQWRTLYKPPIKKRTGDLQWRILHGAIATNSFLSVIYQGVLNECPFCSLSENVFHVFMDCVRLKTIFSLLANVFSLFSSVFTTSLFIGGVCQNKGNKTKARLLNFLISEAKLAIYLSRRDRLQERPHLDAVALWKCNLKARIRLEFHFHRATQNIEDFIQLWGFKNILCTVSDDGELHFNKLLI